MSDEGWVGLEEYDRVRASLADTEAELEHLREECRHHVDYDVCQKFHRDVSALDYERKLRVQAEALLHRIQEAARNAHGILQVNLGDADPHVRAACDLIRAALEEEA